MKELFVQTKWQFKDPKVCEERKTRELLENLLAQGKDQQETQPTFLCLLLCGWPERFFLSMSLSSKEGSLWDRFWITPTSAPNDNLKIPKSVKRGKPESS